MADVYIACVTTHQPPAGRLHSLDDVRPLPPTRAAAHIMYRIATSDPLEREAEYLGDYTYTLMMGAAGLLVCNHPIRALPYSAAVGGFRARVQTAGRCHGLLCTGCVVRLPSPGIAAGHLEPIVKPLVVQEMVPLLWAIPIPAWIFSGFFATLYYCVGGEVPVAEVASSR